MLLYRRPIQWILQTPAIRGGFWRSKGGELRTNLVSSRWIQNSALQPARSDILHLPDVCPGCGAYVQIEEADDPGFFGFGRSTVRSYIALVKGAQNGNPRVGSNLIKHDNSFASSDGDRNEGQKIASSNPQAVNKQSPHQQPATPVCDRCHKLLHHSIGSPVAHPSVESLQEIIYEASYRDNHIYHVLDAADFPMSLVPDLQKRLSLNAQRSKNRRAKAHIFRHGRLMEISFIITRADLLAPTKAQVDRLMPYVVQVLRDALGQSAENARLGNVRLVSAHRGWWTREVKEEIWKRGGVCWLVGKTNVGKSHLLQSIFPKGRSSTSAVLARSQAISSVPDAIDRDRTDLGSNSDGGGALSEAMTRYTQATKETLLPPKPRELDFPTMPTVSTLPGTTAAPIRLPFGNGRGELVDLPGLERGGFETNLPDKSRRNLSMDSRPRPKKISIKPGQTLIIGDFLRISPHDLDAVVLASPFVPPTVRVALVSAASPNSQDKQTGFRHRSDSTSNLISTGVHHIVHDVTKQHAGPLTRKDALGLKADDLPFIIFSTDVVLEGIGWIELVVQVRKKLFVSSRALDGSHAYPKVEIASFEGRHVMMRRPMSASLMTGDRRGKDRR